MGAVRYPAGGMELLISSVSPWIGGL